MCQITVCAFSCVRADISTFFDYVCTTQGVLVVVIYRVFSPTEHTQRGGAKAIRCGVSPSLATMAHGCRFGFERSLYP